MSSARRIKFLNSTARWEQRAPPNQTKA